MFEEENHELPVPPKPDVGTVTGQDRGPSPPTSAALSNEEGADSPGTSLNKVCRSKPASWTLEDVDLSLGRD